MRQLNKPVRGKISREEKTLMRKKSVRDFFIDFSSKFHLPWLKELCAQYKERGIYPVWPMSLLPSYYTDKKDKEIAAFAALLLYDNDDMYAQVSEMRDVITEHPWEWFKSRGFVSLSLDSRRSKRIAGGMINRNYGVLANLMDVLYDRMDKNRWMLSLEESLLPYSCSFFQKKLKKRGVVVSEYRLRLLSLILKTRGGFGLGLWDDYPQDVLCPVSANVCLFLSTWMPDYKIYGTFDDAIRLFGFEWDFDFFYAYLGYEELQKRNPERCGRYASSYQRWYINGQNVEKKYWMRVLPEINLDV